MPSDENHGRCGNNLKESIKQWSLSCEMKICKATWEDESDTHTYLNKWKRDSFTGAAGTISQAGTLPKDSCQKKKGRGRRWL